MMMRLKIMSHDDIEVSVHTAIRVHGRYPSWVYTKLTLTTQLKLERALCGGANPRRLVRQNAAGAPAAMEHTFLL